MKDNLEPETEYKLELKNEYDQNENQFYEEAAIRQAIQFYLNTASTNATRDNNSLFDDYKLNYGYSFVKKVGDYTVLYTGGKVIGFYLG